MCSGCRKTSINARKNQKYVEGVSCPKCYDYLTDTQKARFAMRQKQIFIAKNGKKIFFKKNFIEERLKKIEYNI